MRQKQTLAQKSGRIAASAAKTILVALVNGVAVPFEYSTSSKLFRTARMGDSFLLPSRDFQREIKRLQSKGYISLTKSGPSWYVKLLPKGAKKQQAAQVSELELPKPKQWDGKWRIFFFDIPEDKKSARDQLRSKLKELGMYNFQRSVFAYPYACKQELEQVYKYLGVEKHVTFLVTSTIDIDKELKKHFNL